MRIDAMSKTLAFFDMLDVFQIIPTATISPLEDKLVDLFVSKTDLQSVATDLAMNPLDTEAINAMCICTRSVEEAEKVRWEDHKTAWV